METKFYAPQQGLHCLTLATHPGTLTEQDVVNNLVRMSLMDDELSAEEAMEEARQLPTDKRKALVDDMWWEYNSPEFQDYLIRKQILPSKINEDNLKLVLGQVLLNHQRAGKIFVKYEAKQSCFHITVRQ
jgi:hypothetical protein